MQPYTTVLAQSDQADTTSQGPASNPLSGFLFALGVAILAWVMLRLVRKRRRANEEPGPVEAMQVNIEQRQAEAQRAAEVAEIVRDMAARLETRAARLEALLDLADDRIGQLETRLRGTSANGMVATPAEPAPPPTQMPADDPWAQDDTHAPPSKTGHPPAEPLHQEVYDLADRGHAPLDIARRLEQQVGTIELILALRPGVR
ncbi:MAG: hypothetical protein KIT54_05660 [Phycisphaeraceae bacterium]|nr:hypothetical protein [Phycisphaeraceae bacterium]